MNLRDSFWLIPTLCLIASVLLGIGLIEIDTRYDLRLAREWPLLFGVTAEGARGTLEAIAGSMITVAGVVFSVTIVTLSLAASAYSPRVLRTFMHDRPTQVTLGVLVGIFAYCLVVLRTVRPDETGNGFVPSMAVLTALCLALVGVWVLIYFIHHVSVAIQVPTILQRISDETREAIDALFPDPLGEDDDEMDESVSLPGSAWVPIPALSSGYVVRLDEQQLLRFARVRNGVLRMEIGIGEFAIETQPLASIAGDKGEPGADARGLNLLYTLGPERTIDQDAGFGLQQIVDVAVRALSPGINNPSTAILCIDHLTPLFVHLARRRFPSQMRTDGGELRVIAQGPTFASLVAQAYEPLIHYAAGKDEVLAAIDRSVRIVERAASPRRRLAMGRHMEALARARHG